MFGGNGFWSLGRVAQPTNTNAQQIKKMKKKKKLRKTEREK